jgi:hypothetical protein
MHLSSAWLLHTLKQEQRRMFIATSILFCAVLCWHAAASVLSITELAERDEEYKVR